MENGLEIILSVLIGVCLSAACGFRIFIPMLVAGLAIHTGHVQASESFAWIGSLPALAAFGTAAVVEVLAYYIPWVDNALDTISTPAAVMAGTLLTASFLPEMSSLLRWSLALIVGGGAAGAVQGGSAMTRAASSLTTGGVGNAAVATAELGGAVTTSVAAVTVPVIAFFGLLAVGTLVVRRGRRRAPAEIQPAQSSSAL